MHIGKDSISFYENNYRQLKGWKIIDFKMVQCEYDTSQYWPTFVLQSPATGETLRLILSQDEEGNGGGFAFIEDDQPTSNK